MSHGSVFVFTLLLPLSVLLTATSSNFLIYNLLQRPMQNWDVSQVTSMYQVFKMYYNGQDNECDIPDISGWDVSQVTDFVSIILTCKELSLI